MQGVLTLAIELWTFGSLGGLPSPHFESVNLILTLFQSKVETKVFSKDYIWHMAFLCWYIFLCFAFFIPILQVHCAMYNFFLLHLLHYASKLWITLKWITFVENTFSKFIIFKIKNLFETNVFKCVLKWISPTSSAFVFLIMNIKIHSNLENEWCTFDNEKGCLKKIIILNMQKDSWNIINFHWVLNIETLQVMELKKEKKSIIQFIIFPLWFFKRCFF
jgi:hypothetical protein